MKESTFKWAFSFKLCSRWWVFLFGISNWSALVVFVWHLFQSSRGSTRDQFSCLPSSRNLYSILCERTQANQCNFLIIEKMGLFWLPLPCLYTESIVHCSIYKNSYVYIVLGMQPWIRRTEGIWRALLQTWGTAWLNYLIWLIVSG